MTSAVVIALAGLMGAAGVVLLAAAAHAAPGAGLDSAGQMLLFHAVAALALAAALQLGLVFRPLGIAAVIGLIAGAALFSGDIAMRAFAGHRLFPMAAPSGGVILIASWLALGVAAVIALLRAG
jgi:uncharacterized membrane protein YgdD (TMEM256/DUF423 family)